jgi:hypothetical protein
MSVISSWTKDYISKRPYKAREKLQFCYLSPLNAGLNPICHLLALLGAHHILHVSRIRVKIIFSPLNAKLNSICHLLALLGAHHILHVSRIRDKIIFSPLNAQLNPICHLLALLAAHHILHISRIRVNKMICLHNNNNDLPNFYINIFEKLIFLSLLCIKYLHYNKGIKFVPLFTHPLHFFCVPCDCCILYPE